tara:strand:+ start:18136 stop:20088 length:1953 start_codon:yes stop_codon:yes gene_type:complete
MYNYFLNIYNSVKTLFEGMQLTLKHFNKKEELVATLQYPHEKWPIPERNIGFENDEYNLIRSRLHVDIDDCIGCLQCERACPVDCIKIETVKKPKKTELDFDFGITSNDTSKKMLVSRFSIDMSECMYCNLCEYPCPEECIYMVGGPNEDKHEIDYEFSKYDRKGLIYEFAFPKEEDLVALNAQDYANKKKDREEYLEAGSRLEGLVADEVNASQETSVSEEVVKDTPSAEKKASRKKTKNYSSSEKIGVFYGSSTGNSESICDIIQEELGDGVVELFNVSDVEPEKILTYNHIIISCPTWYEGELQEDWIEFLPKIAALDLKGKTVVMFGMGDQVGYADNFLDALGIIAIDLIKAGAQVKGEWPTLGYEFTKSVGLTPDGKHFYGLGLDEENQANLHNSRLDKWFEMLVDIFNLSVEEIEDLEIEETPEIVVEVKDVDGAVETEVGDAGVKVGDSDSEGVSKVKRIYSSPEKIGLFYGSTTGNSEEVCDRIFETLGEEVIDLLNVSEVDPNKMLEYNHIIISCPTWNEGELQEDWEEFLPKIAALDLKGKTIVMFGLGDQDGYADNFLDALGIIAADLIKAGAEIKGHWSTEGYEFTKSLGLTPDGKHFYGLGLDEENQADLHGERLNRWFDMLMPIFSITAEIVEGEG